MALLFLALIMGSCDAVSKKNKVADDEQQALLLDEDENFWGRDLQGMSMPPPNICIDYQLSFEFLPKVENGLIVPDRPVNTGEYISNQYFDAFGILMSSTNGLEPFPRIFDSAKPGAWDLDLGTPNNDFGGPGRGEGGRRNGDGPNAVARGNVLIVQENDLAERTVSRDEPNDKRGGGTITFDFTRPVRFVEEIGILDIERDGLTTIDVSYYNSMNDDQERFQRILVPSTGNNGVATIPIDLPYVKKLTVNFHTSGAITFVNFCADTIRVGFGLPSPGAGFGAGANNAGFDAAVEQVTPVIAAAGASSSSSKSTKSPKRQRKLKDSPKDSTKTAKGRKLSTNNEKKKEAATSRRYTRGGKKTPTAK